MGFKNLGTGWIRALLKRAAALCRDTSTIGAGYELQGLAEVHCYRKTTHNFTPDEVEELLRFAAPLEVEEKLHRYSFPICELLKADQGS